MASRCLQFNAAAKYVVWCGLIAEFVFEVVTNDVQDEVCGKDAGKSNNNE